MGLFGSTDLPNDGKGILTEQEDAVMEKIAKWVVKKQFTVPAIMFLESIKPMNFIGSQVMVFFEPVVQSVFTFKDYTVFREALEKRESVEILLQKIEARDAAALKREKRVKAYMKEQKKNWKWYQRYLGVFQPKVKIPQEVIDSPPEDESDQNDEDTGDKKK
jgi:hypothetical protein